MSKAVKVICGANEQEGAAGSTVKETRNNFQEVLNIPKNAEAFVGGKKVKEGHVLAEGDSLEFIKPAGDKG
ncbi:MAG: hypothetical protein NT165_00590 [Candidatus Falkowbacteria bacterium]|nr:hypothetical protein [Candidatus Falkowbacteria bacterium]